MEPIACKYCGKMFVPSSKKNVTCRSTDCKHQAKREAAKASHLVQGFGKQRYCAECGKPVEKNSSGHWRHTCSVECAFKRKSAAAKRNNSTRDYSDAEWKEKIATSLRGRPLSEETKEKITESVRKFHNSTGRTLSSDGYVLLNRYGDHPNSHKNGTIREHILVMSNFLGRPLVNGETVHHKNGIREDNRIENLELWTGNHPGGVRLTDLYEFCKDFVEKYKSEYERLNGGNYEH